MIAYAGNTTRIAACSVFVLTALAASAGVTPLSGILKASSPAGSGADVQQTQADPAACKGLLTQPTRVRGVLASTPKYASSYVLIVPQRLVEKVPGADAPALKTIEVGVHAGTPAVDAAKAIGLTRIREYRTDEASPAQPLQDIKDGKLDAAILWAPLAGLAIIEFGLDGQVSVYTVDRPRPAPAWLQGQPVPHACATAIANELDVNGVLPAELLVSVALRDLLGRTPPAFDLSKAKEGAPLFNEFCSTCHGADAVADPHGLAPVDLRMSVQRFSYPAFVYIILNGRPERSMPPLRGTVSDEQIALMYQYLKARSNKLLGASGR